MDHARTPVLDALQAYHARGDLAFTPPGHKQGRGADLRVAEVIGADVFRSDVLVLNGLDDHRMSGGILAQAEELMADAVGAEHAFFSTCGSSLSVKSAMLATAGPHEKLLVSRNAHKSVVAGIIISGITPVWVRPRWDADQMLAHPPGAEEVERALDDHPDAKGMLLISPTAYGTCGPIAQIAEACHRRDRALIVDEAWGAHLPFHPDLPAWAMNAGADVCVTSVHKMGAGLEQGSVFHLQGGLVSPSRLKACEDLLGTTSPSVLVYAGMDGWRRQMVERGHELLDHALDQATVIRAAIDELPGLHVLAGEFVAEGMAAEYDPLMVVVDVAALATSGYVVGDWLRTHHHVNVGLADHRRIVVQLTHADDERTVGGLLAALRDLVHHAEDLPPAPPILLPNPDDLSLETALEPREAFFGSTEDVPADKAVGRIGAEMLSPYPPGVPVVAPGERLNAAVVDYLRSGAAAGMFIPDAADPHLSTIRVVSSPAR
jgi:arginine decarboxylase